jgi:branched-chain amino acid transport system ATP-binding protein
MTALLEVEDLRVSYGAIEAVKGVSFIVEAGQIVTLIGGNGAGKTTTLRTVSGLLQPTDGDIRYGGRSIRGMPGHEVLRLGVAHAPEGRRIFGRMSIEENLDLGAFARTDRSDIGKDMNRVYELFPVLGERRGQSAGVLSGGEQQMLAIGRAMMSRPKLLMLDEPSMGLSPIMMQRIFTVIGELQEQGTTILLVEQNALSALALSDRGYVIDLGRTTLSGTGQELLADPRVQEAYLGEGVGT